MHGRDILTNGATAIAVLCAVVMTGLTLKRELSPTPVVAAPGNAGPPQPVENWASYAGTGHRIGPANAVVTVVEFADFECPACRKFANGPLKTLHEKYPDQIAFVFRHWPLSYHRFAYPAARAAECAADQGRFEQMHTLLYAQQDSLGLKPWTRFARESGVADAERFTTCVEDTAKVPAIERDVAAAKQIGARGTPTILINGLRYSNPPGTVELEAIIDAALKKAQAKP